MYIYVRISEFDVQKAERETMGLEKEIHSETVERVCINFKKKITVFLVNQIKFLNLPKNNKNE